MNVFDEIKQDRILFRGSIFSSALIIFSIISIFLYYGSLPPFIPLFNQMPWGEQRITETIWIFLIPAISLTFLILNLIFAGKIYRNVPLIARLFSMTSFLISILSFLFIVRTINAAL